MPTPSSFFSRWLLACLLLVSAAHAQPAAGPVDADVRDALNLPDSINQKLQLIHAWDARTVARYDPASTAAAPEHFEAAHLGENRLLMRLTYVEEPDFRVSRLILYMDLDDDRSTGRGGEHHEGVDVMFTVSDNNARLRFHSPDYHQHNTEVRYLLDDEALYILLETPLPEEGEDIPLDLYIASERDGGDNFNMGRNRLTLPRSHDQPADMPDSEVNRLNEVGGHRFQGDGVALEAFENRGLRREQVEPADPIEFGRERPDVPFHTQARRPGRSGDINHERVRVELKEESGVDRPKARVRFGFPLPEYAVYDLDHLRIVDDQDVEQPAQLTVTSFWPDESLKWVLVEFHTGFNAHEKRDYFVELGNDVQRHNPDSPLQWEQTDDRITVTTGPMRAAIDTERFNLLHRVWVDEQGEQRFDEQRLRLESGSEGIQMRGRDDALFSTAALPPDRVTIEEAGERKLTVRVEGGYGDEQGQALQRYITRLKFRAGSTRIRIAHTHLNDNLDREFTDIRSLTWPLHPAGEVAESTVYAGTGEYAEAELESLSGSKISVFQADERTSRFDVDEQQSEHGSSPGLVRVRTDRGPLTGVMHEFWQRWPKGIDVEAGRLDLHLLPPQPDDAYGQDLPHYLKFPFVQGHYRSKWGMSFTERLTLDFSEETDPRALRAEADMPLVAVLPAEWYARTHALGQMPAPRGEQFSLWDHFVAESFRRHVDAKQRTREYGYTNYGDWFGERGRNWGNNEYDRAQNFFLHFARTGERDYYRLALAAARHQADVDIIHAYPDPYYIGANTQHSVAHTGTWSSRPEYATWSHRHGRGTAAGNGHTWADGMTMAWHLSGDARVMEAAQTLGEHIVWAFSKQFDALGTHERSAGWSLRAIIALYRSTYDPLYLEAAERIADVALSEQQFDEGGAWPHRLPPDHAAGRGNLVGNNLFMIGTLLSGLKAYHEVTGDPEVARSLESGAQWVLKSWDEDAGGWPYSALADGTPIHDEARIHLNPIIITGLAYVATLNDDEEMMRIVHRAISTTFSFDGPQTDGKSISIRMHFVPEVLALLQQWYEQHDPDEAERLLSRQQQGAFRRMLLELPTPERFDARAPDRKLFHVQLDSSSPTLTATRRPHGGIPPRMEQSSFTVYNAQGEQLSHESFDPDETEQIELPLTGQAGDEFIIAIEDDQRAVWDVQGPRARVLAHLNQGFRIGGVGRSRYQAFVPEGASSFTVRVVGVHSGTYGVAVLDPQGRLVAHLSDSYPGRALMPTDEERPRRGEAEHPLRELRVEPEPEQTGQLWQIALWGHGDIGVELEGIPPLLALEPDHWFMPQAIVREAVPE